MHEMKKQHYYAWKKKNIIMHERKKHYNAFFSFCHSENPTICSLCFSFFYRFMLSDMKIQPYAHCVLAFFIASCFPLWKSKQILIVFLIFVSLHAFCYENPIRCSLCFCFFYRFMLSVMKIQADSHCVFDFIIVLYFPLWSFFFIASCSVFFVLLIFFISCVVMMFFHFQNFFCLKTFTWQIKAV